MCVELSTTYETSKLQKKRRTTNRDQTPTQLTISEDKPRQIRNQLHEKNTNFLL